MDKGQSRQVLVCGGGNGAHCLTALSALLPDTTVNVLTLYADEAMRWKNSSDENGGIDLTIYSDGTKNTVKTKPSLITKDPKTAMKDVNIVFLTVPAFAHEQYLKALYPYIQPNTLIVGLPGQAGFEFQCKHILAEKMSTSAVVSFESLPWACRILEFGRHVELLGFKETLGASIIKGNKTNLPFPPFQRIQTILGKEPKVREIQNYIAVTLMAKSIVHPPMMYGKWSTFDGQPLTEKPLFYQGIDERQADLLSRVSDEVVNTAKAIEEQRPEMDMKEVIHIFDWYKVYYKNQIKDNSSLQMAMKTNAAYDGLVHPMKKTEDGRFIPDFNYRYVSEDVPYGLVVLKGIAVIAGVQTPVMDEVITWCQKQLNKEYIVGDELVGKNLNETRAPQCFGLKTMDDLFFS